ncbi:MAG: GntR family transcriptional regulator [Kordiimonadaceae bacterium]|nr:GntR family transcriptional regulator [Kordiimonadaceae bacterium]
MPASDTVINDLDEAYEIVLDAIVTQILAPGQKVSENILSDMFGISRTVSRNMIERLIAKHFLISVSQRVTQVAPLTLMEIKQNFALRKMLLPEIVSMASGNVNYDELYALNDKITARLPIKDDASALKVLKTNKQLNLLICQEAGYPLMTDWVEQLEDMAMRVYWIYVRTKKSFPYLSEQQANTFAIMKNGEPAAIRKAIHDLLTQTEERILNAIFSHEQFYTQNLKV